MFSLGGGSEMNEVTIIDKVKFLYTLCTPYRVEFVFEVVWSHKEQKEE